MNKLCPVDAMCQSNANSGGTGPERAVPVVTEWAICCESKLGYAGGK